MDKFEKQKVQNFLISLDQKLKTVKDFLQLEKGELLLDEIAKFEEENGEFLRFNSVYQEELNKRKWIIQYLIFPIISDDKVVELLQYHLLEAIEVGLNIEDLMRMRAITISELLWPKVSQEYLKALSQNTQLIGSDPLVIEREKSTYLPYIKNWISVYNQRFGIDKHGGLEPHQFVLENPNAQRLEKSLKESLLKVLKIYESLKVFSLSEIEGELRKMQMGAVAQQAVAYSITSGSDPKMPSKQSVPASTPQSSTEKVGVVAGPTPGANIFGGRIKIAQTKYQPKESTDNAAPVTQQFQPTGGNEADGENHSETASTRRNDSPALSKKEENSNRAVLELPIIELMDRYPEISNYKITGKSITLPTAPFSLIPTVQNWIDYYYKECGKGRHSPQEREVFIEKLKTNQGLGPVDSLKLSKVLRSVDDKTALPHDQKNKELLLDSVKRGETLKKRVSYSPESKISAELDKIIPKTAAGKSKLPTLQGEPVKKISPINKGGRYSGIELVPGGINEEDAKV